MSTEINKRQRNIVIDHIRSFKAFSCRSPPPENKVYYFLSPELNIPTMYKLYLKKCEEDQIHPVVSEEAYTKVFKEDFNYYFGLPSRDTCPNCYILKKRIEMATDEEEKKKALEIYNTHLETAELERKEIEKSIIEAETDPDKCLVIHINF